MAPLSSSVISPGTEFALQDPAEDAVARVVLQNITKTLFLQFGTPLFVTDRKQMVEYSLECGVIRTIGPERSIVRIAPRPAKIEVR
jgi:hypothetical protein